MPYFRTAYQTIMFFLLFQMLFVLLSLSANVICSESRVLGLICDCKNKSAL